MAHKTKITYSLGVIRRVHSLPVEEETNTRDVLALTVAERIHEFLELGSPLNLEEDLVVVIRHLDVEVFRLAGVLRLLHIVGASVVGHGCGEWGSRLLVMLDSYRCGGLGYLVVSCFVGCIGSCVRRTDARNVDFIVRRRGESVSPSVEV
jgi:hypothetical protein